MTVRCAAITRIAATFVPLLGAAGATQFAGPAHTPGSPPRDCGTVLQTRLETGREAGPPQDDPSSQATADARAQAQAPSTAPASRPAGDQTPAATDATVDRILTQLERRRVLDLRADVLWELEYVIEEDKTSKTGKLWYKEIAPIPQFKVHFNAKIVGSRKDPLDEEHLFDGRWYVELNSETRTVSRTELRREDDPGNPYKLGEGAFPLPFGQSKADILREFTVQRLEPAKDDPPNTDHLLLVPRPATRTGEMYKSLDFWIAQDGALAGLPVKVQAGRKDGTGALNSMITVTFKSVELDTGFSVAELQIRTPPGYEEITERLPPPASDTVVIPAPAADKP